MYYLRKQNIKKPAQPRQVRETQVLTQESEALKRMNEILKGQIETLLKLNAESAQQGVASGRRGRARRENMDTISEASPQ